MPIPEKKWTVEEVKSDSVTKKDVVEYIQSLATLDVNINIYVFNNNNNNKKKKKIKRK